MTSWHTAVGAMTSSTSTVKLMGAPGQSIAGSKALSPSTSKIGVTVMVADPEVAPAATRKSMSDVRNAKACAYVSTKGLDRPIGTVGSLRSVVCRSICRRVLVGMVESIEPVKLTLSSSSQTLSVGLVAASTIWPLTSPVSAGLGLISTVNPRVSPGQVVPLPLS